MNNCTTRNLAQATVAMTDMELLEDEL